MESEVKILLTHTKQPFSFFEIFFQNNLFLKTFWNSFSPVQNAKKYSLVFQKWRVWTFWGDQNSLLFTTKLGGNCFMEKFFPHHFLVKNKSKIFLHVKFSTIQDAFQSSIFFLNNISQFFTHPISLFQLFLSFQGGNEFSFIFSWCTKKCVQSKEASKETIFQYYSRIRQSNLNRNWLNFWCTSIFFQRYFLK